MKKIFISCLVMFIAFNGIINAQNKEEANHKLNWQESISKAITLSKSENKPLLLFFTGSDWCGSCNKLVADFFESDKFKVIADKEFVLYEADFPRNKDLLTASQKKDNNKLRVKYGVSSFPTIIVLDINEKILGKIKGYNLMRETSYHYTFIDTTLKKKKQS